MNSIDTSRQNRQYFAAKKLYGERAGDFLKSYRRKKKILILIVLSVSALSALITAIQKSRDPDLVQGKYIARNGKDGHFKNVTVNARASNGYTKTMQLKVDQQLYTKDELLQMWPSFTESVKETIFSEGDCADYVSRDMNLITALPGYPFSLAWRSEQPLILSGDGKIHEERLAETQQKNTGVIVLLHATATYHDFSEEMQIPVRIFGRYLTKEEVFWEEADKSIREWSEKSAYNAYQQLPVSVGEEDVSYSEQGGREWLFLLLCGVALVVLLIRHMDEDLLKQVRKRDELLEWEYPRLVNRFVLYYGAGLTIKNIWQKICRDYEDRKKITGTNCAYEEMLKAEKKMQDGVGESEAYSAFSSAISLTRYRNLVNLLQQTLQTGGGDIKEQLNEQLTEAFSEQKRHARILGEKAGTRMLLPMFLMLMIVLAIILIPAFLSF